MIKRVAALLLCFVLLAALPLSALAAETDGTAAAPSSVRYISSGDIFFGTASLYDAAGNELPLEYAYSPRITISQSIAEQLTDTLRDCGFALPAMQFDYQMMNMQSFFVVRVTDGQALAKIIDAMVTAPAAESEVSGSDVSSSDVSPSDVSDSDAEAFVIPPYVGGTQFDNSQQITTSLHSLLFGAATFDSYPTLEESFARAFPEFTFQQPAAAALPYSLSYASGVIVDEDNMSAQITVMPEPEYVEREVFGEVFQVLMVSSVAYRYNLSRYDIAGGTSGAVIPEKPVVSDTDIPDDTEENETASTEETTAATTTTTTTTATSTAENDTTTEATTTTTAAPDDSSSDEFPCSGVVTTKRLRLNVRSGPGTSYKVIAKLDKGETVTVVGYEDGWYKIELSDGSTGWCTDEYITLK